MGQPLGIGALLGLTLEDLDEFATDDFPLGLWVGDSAELAHELLGSVHMHHARMEPAYKHVHDRLAFI